MPFPVVLRPRHFMLGSIIKDVRKSSGILEPLPPMFALGTDLQRGAKVGAPGSVNMGRKIAFSCLLQAGEQIFSSQVHQTRPKPFSGSLYSPSTSCGKIRVKY